MQQPEKQEHMLKYAHEKYGNDIEIKSAEKNVLKFFTEDMSVTLTCGNTGKITEKTRMRRGHAEKTEGKPKKVHDGMHQLTFEEVFKNDTEKQKKDNEQSADVKLKRHRRTKAEMEAARAEAAKTVDDISSDKPKRHRRTKAEMEAARAAESKTKEELQADKPKRHRRTKAEIEAAKAVQQTNPDTDSDKIPESATSEAIPDDGANEDTGEDIKAKEASPCPFVVGECVEAKNFSRVFTVLETDQNVVRVLDNSSGSDYTMAVADLKHSNKKPKIIDEKVDK